MFFLKDGTCDYHYSVDNPIVYEELKQDGSNKSSFYNSGADVKSFERNAAGYIRSDIAAIREQQDQAVAAAMLSRLQEIPADNPNAGKSDAEILLSHKSKYCQTPSEMTKYIEGQLELRESQVKAGIADNPDAIKFDPIDGAVESDKE